MTPRELTEQAQRDGAALERARILGVAATPADAEELATALRAIHDGSDRGELRRLLVRLWGPSPAVSDLRGLAARESAPPIHTFPDRCVCENGNWPDGAECPCDCHGPPSSYDERELARLY